VLLSDLRRGRCGAATPVGGLTPWGGEGTPGLHVSDATSRTFRL